MASHPEASPHRKSGAERRRWPRATCELPITLTVGGQRCEARLRDVSRAGVCFYLERPIAEMTVLAFALDVVVDGAVKPIRGKGVVVRCAKISPTLKHYEIAVFLNELPDADRELLDAQVRSGAPVP
jgi:hypothetical protein